VLVKDLSRLGRDYLKVGFSLEQFFPEHNVRFIAISGGIDSNTDSTDFLPLYSVMDEWYAKDISHEVHMMYQIRATKGEPVGTVYGYTRSPKHPKYWEPDPKAARVVQRIYRLAFQRYGTEEIAMILEQNKILIPSQYRLVRDSYEPSCHPYRWASSAVAKILTPTGILRRCGQSQDIR
jgi:DNA invertase Pin-like site-specific DNA recombinase